MTNALKQLKFQAKITQKTNKPQPRLYENDNKHKQIKAVVHYQQSCLGIVCEHDPSPKRAKLPGV
jgi:hypothetical protein